MKKMIYFVCFVSYSVLTFLIGGLFIAKKAEKIIISKQKSIEKNQKLFFTLNNWLEQKQKNKNIIGFLKKNNYKSLAIYGLGIIGKLLVEELSECIDIIYGIDRRDVVAEFPVYKVEGNLPEVDMVIVTAVCDFEEIEELLRKKLHCPIYSIEDIIYFMD